MKTLAWTPAQDDLTAEFKIDDEVIFSSRTVALDKRVGLMTALLSGADYAGRGIDFEIRSMSQDTLVVFEPGQPIKGYRSILRALVEAAGHLDYHAKTIATAAATYIKVDAQRVYEQGVVHGAAAAKKRFEETGDFGLVQAAEQVAPATAAAEQPAAAAPEAPAA